MKFDNLVDSILENTLPTTGGILPWKEVPGTREQDGYNVYKLKDAQGNKFITYAFPATEVGTKMKVKAKIQAHKEILGVKFNKIGYVKPAK